MLKARSGDRFILGLSARNIELLLDGRPIDIDLRELGAPGGRVVIFYGKNEADMLQQLEDAGIELDQDKEKKS